MTTAEVDLEDADSDYDCPLCGPRGCWAGQMGKEIDPGVWATVACKCPCHDESDYDCPLCGLGGCWAGQMGKEIDPGVWATVACKCPCHDEEEGGV